MAVLAGVGLFEERVRHGGLPHNGNPTTTAPLVMWRSKSPISCARLLAASSATFRRHITHQMWRATFDARIGRVRICGGRGATSSPTRHKDPLSGTHPGRNPSRRLAVEVGSGAFHGGSMANRNVVAIGTSAGGFEVLRFLARGFD
jgi:chemotaxis response regulator CheB